MTYTKFERLLLRNNAQFNEKWVQERIAEDPSILGLGDLVLKDKERIQPRAGRLDLLDYDKSWERFRLKLSQGDIKMVMRTNGFS